MSNATRIINRKRWRAECPAVYRSPSKRFIETLTTGRLSPVRVAYHVWAIARKLRGSHFQQGIRGARAELGLPQTSTNMHTVNGSVP